MPDLVPRNFRIVREIVRRDVLFSVARVPNTDRLLLASSEGKVYDLDASRADGPVRELSDHGRYVTCVRLAGSTVISGGYDGRLLWWDLQENLLIRMTDQAHTRPIRQLAVSPDGRILASVADDMVCRLWDTTTGEKLHELRGHSDQTPQHFTSMLYACAFSADGSHLATGDRVGHVVIWDTATGQQLATLEAPTLYTWDGTQRIRSIGGIRALAFSPDGRHLAIGGVGQIGNVDGLSGPSRVEIHDWAQNQRVLEFTGPQGIINVLHYDPLGKYLAAFGGGGNGISLFYDPTARAMLQQPNMPMMVRDVSFSEDGSTVYIAGHHKIAIVELRA